MSHRTLSEYYNSTFSLVHYYQWHLETLEGLPIFEFDMYKDMVIEEMKKKKSNANG